MKLHDPVETFAFLEHRKMQGITVSANAILLFFRQMAIGRGLTTSSIALMISAEDRQALRRSRGNHAVDHVLVVARDFFHRNDDHAKANIKALLLASETNETATFLILASELL